MSIFSRRSAKRAALKPLEDPHAEMAERASAAVAQTISAAHEAVRHAEEAERLLGAIRREVAVTTQKARGDKK